MADTGSVSGHHPLYSDPGHYRQEISQTEGGDDEEARILEPGG